MTIKKINKLKIIMITDFNDYIKENIEDILNHYNRTSYTIFKSNKYLKHRSLGWNKKDEQYSRFEDLLEIGVENDDSILDFGCGYGDLYDLVSKKYKNIFYTGVDINIDFINDAKKNYGDFFYKINKKEDIKNKYDWILASGVFTVYTSDNTLYETIDYLYNICNKGISFNLLWGNNKPESNYEIEKNPNWNTLPIRGYDLNKIKNYFKKKYNNIKIKIFREDLEFTVYIYK